jgi:hypothetical protein
LKQRLSRKRRMEMNTQNIDSQTISTGDDDDPEKEKYNKELNRDRQVDRVPADAEILSETPMGGTVASVPPLDSTIDEDIPVDDTYLYKTPLGGTLASRTPVDETLIHEVPKEELTVQESTMDEDIHYNIPAGELNFENSVIATPIPIEPLSNETTKFETPIVGSATPLVALLSHEDSQQFRTRWNEIQGKFVDEPRTAVQEADKLVEDVVEQISSMFTKEHDTLVSQWKQGNDVSTEDLRKTLQRYRSFFNRLVV